jgi:hypothetical protein
MMKDVLVKVLMFAIAYTVFIGLMAVVVRGETVPNGAWSAKLVVTPENFSKRMIGLPLDRDPSQRLLTVFRKNGWCVFVHKSAAR